MKKIRNNNKKIILIILIVMLLNIILPTYSNAAGATGITSIITKPLQTLIVQFLDQTNGFLAGVFACDSKAAGLVDDAKNAWEDFKTNKDQNGFLNAIWQGLDDFGTSWYNLLLSPDDIFSGKIQITNANLFSSKFDENGKLNVADLNVFNHLMKQLKQTAAGLYYTMRNLAVVILLCLLIYTGIRIVLSSNNAGEKAQWKMYLFDWLKALALVMFIHIIMIGIFYIADIVTDGLNQTINGDMTVVTQIRKNFNDLGAFDRVGAWIYAIMYGYVTYLTIVFLVAYFKRLFYIIVLVVIAPIMSALYAMGKTTKANFNRWFKEFTMGVFVQPFHLLIYSILLVMPMNAMGNSGLNLTIGGVQVWTMSTIDIQIYALIAISMIRPIEKYMRKILGFGETLLDNVASFDSGKKTVDAGVKVVKEVAKTAVMVGATIATAGAAAPALGAGAGAGAAGTTGVASKAATSAAQGMAQNVGQTLGNEGLRVPFGEMGKDIVPAEDYVSGDLFHDDYNPMLNSEFEPPQPRMLSEDELQQHLDTYRDTGYSDEEIAAEEEELRSLGHGNRPNVNSESTVTSATQASDNKGNDPAELENNLRREGHGLMNESQLQNYLDELGFKGEERAELEDYLRKDGHGDQGEHAQDAIFNNANVQINQADTMDVNSVNSINTKELETSANESVSEQQETERLEAENIEAQQITNGQKRDVSGSELGRTLLEKIRDARATVEANPMYQAFTSPQNQEGLQNVRAAMHELTDSFYASDVPGDWKANVEYSKKGIEKKKEERLVKFINDPKNIDKAISQFNLKDKKDKEGNVISTAKDQAKEKLKGMEPYVSSGITDIGKITVLQATGQPPKQAMYTYLKNNREETKVKNFITNKNNVESMRNIVADRMKIPLERRNEPTVLQQINEQVNQDFREGAKYIASGDAKDTQTLDKLLQLERKIDQQVNLKGTASISKEDYVVKANKLVEKALKDGMKNIKLPGADKNVAVKELQKVLNNELKARRLNLNSPSASTPNASSTSRTNSSSSTRQKPESNTRQAPSGTNTTLDSGSSSRRPRQIPPAGPTTTNNSNKN